MGKEEEQAVTSRGEKVDPKLAWGNTTQSAEDRAAEHLASGSSLPEGSQSSQPPVIHK